LIGLALLIVRPNMTWRNLILWGGAAVICFGIVLAPYLIFNLRVTGGLLPNTAAAKRAEGAYYLAQSYLWRVGNLLTPLAAGGQLLLIPGMIAYAVLLPRKRASILYALLLVWPVALILLYAETLPLEIQHGRYLIPSLPGAIIVGVVGMGWLLQRTRASLIGRVLVRVVAGSAALVFALFALVLGLQAYVQDVAIINQEMVASAEWIKANIPADDLMVVHDIGAVGYFDSRPVLDIGGLISPEFVPLIHDPNAVWNLIHERGGKYLMALDTQIPGGDVHDPHLCPKFTTGGTAAPRADARKLRSRRASTHDSNPKNSRLPSLPSSLATRSPSSPCPQNPNFIFFPTYPADFGVSVEILDARCSAGLADRNECVSVEVAGSGALVVRWGVGGSWCG